MIGITKLYGAYGSNMNLEQMSHRCPKAKVVGTGTLEGYKLTFRGRYKGVANVELGEGRKVPIVLWNITKECEKALDLYEGYPNLYIKEDVEVTVGDTTVKAMIYVMAKKYKDLIALPPGYYFNVIAKGYEDNEIDLKTLRIAYSECIKEIEHGGING